MKKTFVLGLGHQKCGTTWLHRYLMNHPNFDGGFTKEYHVWDALDVDISRSHRVDPKIGEKPSGHPVYLRHRMQTDVSFYFDYFDSLYSDSIDLCADITPSYSGLSAGRLHRLERSFSDRGVRVKPVILVRDPLSRVKSAVRFNLDRKNYGEGIEEGETNFENALGQYFRSEHCLLRTRYDRIIEAVAPVFDDGDIYIGVFENMFDPHEIERLSEYLEVDPVTDFGRIKVNETKGRSAETDLDAEIRDFYSDVYRYCFRNIPATEALWNP